MTRAEHLRLDIAFALRDLKIHGRKGALTEEQRYAIADHVIRQLRKFGDPWKLDEKVSEGPLRPQWDWFRTS